MNETTMNETTATETTAIETTAIETTATETKPKKAATKPKKAATKPKKAVTKPKKAVTKPKKAAGNRPGRKPMSLVLPESNTFTINDLASANPVVCRLTLYKHRDRWMKEKVIRATKLTQPTGGVGKPLTVYERVNKTTDKTVTLVDPVIETSTVPVEVVV